MLSSMGIMGHASLGTYSLLIAKEQLCPRSSHGDNPDLAGSIPEFHKLFTAFCIPSPSNSFIMLFLCFSASRESAVLTLRRCLSFAKVDLMPNRHQYHLCFLHHLQRIRRRHLESLGHPQASQKDSRAHGALRSRHLLWQVHSQLSQLL